MQGAGFEPAKPLRAQDLKSCAFGHSATLAFPNLQFTAFYVFLNYGAYPLSSLVDRIASIKARVVGGRALKREASNVTASKGKFSLAAEA